jgi:hypothetical protein
MMPVVAPAAVVACQIDSQQQRAEGQRVAGHDPLQVGWGQAELMLDGGQGHVDDVQLSARQVDPTRPG